MGAAVVIAVRYAAVRKQFVLTKTDSKEEETPIIEYELHVSYAAPINHKCCNDFLNFFSNGDYSRT